ncbi:MAG: dihydropteroate synthase [Legionellales bacterium]|nr:dihydropteroate synthase [Legionellales bacterium]
MGVLNVTPDSFSDAGRFVKGEDAVLRARAMLAEGVDMIDVGGESSRPGAVRISEDEELSRVIPVIERICDESDVCVSIDTYKPVIMEAAVKAGASFINDIKALTEDGALSVAVNLQVPVCLMHMQGIPKTMQVNPHYANDVVCDINHFFLQRIDACVKAGLSRKHLVLDPGFGFGKSVSHNLSIVKRLGEFQHHHLPLMLGVSRKSTLGVVLSAPVENRWPGAIATEIFATLQGVSIIRTHDVEKTNQALHMIDAIVGNSPGN